MNFNNIVISILIYFLTLPGSIEAHADIKTDLQNYVDSIGGSVNVTDPSIVKGQGYGYFNGGSISLRVPQRTVSLGHISLPDYKVGSCGSIDGFNGGYSFINAQNFVDTLKQIGANAKGYLFMLGIRTVSAQIASTMETVKSWAQKFNNLNINTCEIAQKGVDAVLDSAKLQMCIQDRMENNGEKYAEAKNNCTVTNGKQNQTLDTPENKDKKFIDGNLAWIVATKANMFGGDQQMKELMMSITGTIIKYKSLNGLIVPYSNEDRKVKNVTEYKASLLLNDDSILDALLYGGNGQIYSCPSNSGKYECKVLTQKALTIPYSSSLFGKFNTAFQNIFDAIKNKSTPSQFDSNLMINSGFSANTYITLAASIGGSAGDNLLQVTSERAAINTLYNYTLKLIRSMKTIINDPRYLSKEYQTTFNENLKEVEDIIVRKKEAIDTKLKTTSQLVQDMTFYKQMLVSRMPKNLADNLLFDKR